MKLKPFNFYEWLKNKEQPVYTRDGDKVLFLQYVELPRWKYNLFGVKTDNDDCTNIACWIRDGRFYDDHSESESDLMLVEGNGLPIMMAYSELQDEILYFIKQLKDRDEKI